MTRHERILSLLDDIARDVEPIASARVAAGIVYKNELICIGTNSRKTHPFQKKYSKHPAAISIHAENSAIVRALKLLSLDELSASTMYISRMKHESWTLNPVKGDLRRGLSKPCLGCARSILSFNIKNVCYTTEEGIHEWLV